MCSTNSGGGKGTAWAMPSSSTAIAPARRAIVSSGGLRSSSSNDGTSRPARADSPITRSNGSRSRARSSSNGPRSARDLPPVGHRGSVARTEVPRKPLELLTQGYQHFRVLATALEFRLFTLLPSKGATIPEIARLLGLKERPARTLVNAVAVLALIEKRGNRFRNTRLAATYLVEGHPQFYGDFIRMMDRRLYHAYENLGWALREEKPVTADPAVGDVFRTMARDPQMTRLFTMGVDAAGRYSAECLARSVDLSRTRLLLDVGGGSGVYSIALAKRFRKLRAIIFDLPEVLPVTRERIRAAGLEDP